MKAEDAMEYTENHERIIGKMMLDRQFRRDLINDATRVDALMSLGISDSEAASIAADIEDYLSLNSHVVGELAHSFDTRIEPLMG